MPRGNERIAFVGNPQQCQIRQHFGPLLASGKGVKHVASGFTHQVGKDRAEFDVGFLQQLVDAIDMARSFLLQTGAKARSNRAGHAGTEAG